MKTSMNEQELQALQGAIERLRAALQEQYEFLLFEPEVRPGPDGPELHGQVLTARQHQQALEALREVYPGPVLDRLHVLESDAQGRPLFHYPAPGAPLDVWSSPRLEKLATQVLPGDPPFALLLEMEERALIRAADGSLGWIERLALERCLPAETQPEFAPLPCPASPEQEERVRLGVWAFGLEHLGAPYRLGGRDLQRGLDCSALAQHAYAQSSEAVLPRPILLPKHSLDQMKAGLRIAPEEAAQGDLIFLRHAVKKYSHVAIFSGPQEGLVVHASREAGGVVTEPVEALLARYRLLGFRTYFQGEK